jgi:hypothetical protein
LEALSVTGPISAGARRFQKKRRFALKTEINSYDLVIARCFLALIFVVEGISKISDADATRHYMQARHLPGGLLWPVILFQCVAAIIAPSGNGTLPSRKANWPDWYAMKSSMTVTMRSVWLPSYARNRCALNPAPCSRVHRSNMMRKTKAASVAELWRLADELQL